MENRYTKFTLLITNIYRSIHKIKSYEMKKLGLKSTHVSCLFYLHEFGSQTAAALCSICDEDKASMSRVLKDLENKGYIVSEETLPKKYRSKLSLTSTGSKVAEKISCIAAEMVSAGSNGLPEENRNAFYNSLELIAGNLEKICEEYKND